MLMQQEVVHYLVQHSLIPARLVVDGDFVVLDATSRHANLHVLSETGPSFHVKQGIGSDREAALANEAAVYRLLHSVASSDLRRYLAGFHLYSGTEALLVLEMLQQVETLQEHHRRTGRFSVRLAAQIGEALAALHQPVMAGEAAREIGIAYKAPPWVLRLHRPSLELYNEASHANLQFIRTMQRYPALGQQLDALRLTWQPRALVHYDVKANNLLVTRSPKSAQPSLRIVDWELAGLGDPCWDTGSVFAEYLTNWLLSIPSTGEGLPDQLLEFARFPLEKVQPAMRRFWSAYVGGMQPEMHVSFDWLLRSTCYCAARLLQTAFEQGQGSMQLSGPASWLLQLGFNILQRPYEAIVHLLGISLEGMVA